MSDKNRHLFKAGKGSAWSQVNPDEHNHFSSKDEARLETENLLCKIDQLQAKLYAEGKQALLIVLQGMDTCGKDGTIRHVFRQVNPQGCIVSSFGVPTPRELAHDFLWRVQARVPPKGIIGIFNRSHYEDVLVPLVHRQVKGAAIQQRYESIIDWEKHLTRNGVRVLKFFLAISREEQRERLQARLDNPHKRWKFNPSDLAERQYWDAYMKAYSAAIAATSKRWAPWYLIPANHEWYRDYVIASTIHATLADMDPRYPPEFPGLDFSTLKIPD